MATEPSGCLLGSSAWARGDEGAGGAEGDFGREGGLAHAGAAGEDHEVGGVQAAGLLVEVAETGGEAADMAGLLEGAFGAEDGLR